MKRLCYINIIFLLICTETAFGDGQACSMKSLLPGCGENEICIQTHEGDDAGSCHCEAGYISSDGKCSSIPTLPPTTPIPRNSSVQPPTAEPHTDTQSKNAVVAGIIVPLLLISALVGGLVYLGRRHGWMQRLRQLRPVSRRTNDVLIGRPDDDDDPIV